MSVGLVQYIGWYILSVYIAVERAPSNLGFAEIQNKEPTHHDQNT